MRLWSIHPRYLDGRGLVACWRETLLARAVLSGKTRGYRRHPQLERFRAHAEPIRAINGYLFGLWQESRRRGFQFDAGKLGRARTGRRIAVTAGQVRYELSHLRQKLWIRDRRRYYYIRRVREPEIHPSFRIVQGGIEKWERVSSDA